MTWADGPRSHPFVDEVYCTWDVAAWQEAARRELPSTGNGRPASVWS